MPPDSVMSDHFSIYCFPSELDYYDENFRKEHRLFQMDTALFPKKIPAPYSLPDEFQKLPGQTIYVSLGSLVSQMNLTYFFSC